MPANTNQIFSAVPNTGAANSGAWFNADGNGGAAGPLKTANNVYDGTGTVLTIFQAGANGGRIEQVRARAAGTNVATVLRVFLNNNLTNATVANNLLIYELTLPATTASAVAATADQYIGAPIFPMSIDPNFKVNVVLGTTVAAGYFVSCVGGSY